MHTGQFAKTVSAVIGNLFEWNEHLNISFIQELYCVKDQKNALIIDVLFFEWYNVYFPYGVTRSDSQHQQVLGTFCERIIYWNLIS